MRRLWVSALFVLACNTPAKEAPAPSSAVANPLPQNEPHVASSGPSTFDATVPTTATSAVPSAKSAALAALPAPVTSSTPKGVGCTKDAECRTFSSYCATAPCACQVLSASEGDPKCLGGKQQVTCFVDPCMKKQAQCQRGACVLTNAGAPTQ